MAKKKVAPSRLARERKAQVRGLLAFSLTVFFIKIIWLSSNENKGLLGADGENYLQGLEGLLSDGLFSSADKLSYWPAGYPILMWPIAAMSVSNLGFIVGIIQSLIFALAIWFFAIELSATSLKRFAWPAAIILSLSPTLSLNSVVIGYEVTSASLFLLAISLFLRQVRIGKRSILNWENSLAAFAIAISCFMQPRILLLSLGIFIPFAIYHFRGRAIPTFLAFTLSIVAIAPSIMILRNIEANGYAAISTNLGATMNIGAGPESTGGYTNKATGVPCEMIEGNAAEQDSYKVACVLKWYLENPGKSAKLFVNKFFFHWSPWFGPLAKGTMVSDRNPWVLNHPFAKSAQATDGFKIVMGGLGKTISWAWVLGSLALLIYGFVALRRRGGVSTLLAWCLFIPVLLNTGSSMGTIGDHRFRIPTLTLSILLQLFGLYAIFERRSFKRGLDGKVRLALGLNWKGRGQGDNLQP
jgi:hypothetical protein